MHPTFSITLNVANVLAAWTALCALVSLLNKYIITPNWPTVGRVMSALLNILPGHIGQLITDVQAILNDLKTPPAPPANGGDAPPPAAPVTPPPPPATSRVGLAMLGAVGLFSLQTGAFALTTSELTACTPAQQAEVKSVEQTILHDLSQGKTLEQTELDVATIIAGQPGADAVIVFNDALALVIDAGWVPADLMQEALQWLSQIAPIAAEHRANPLQMDGGAAQ